MSQQWPPESNPPEPGDPRAPVAWNGQGDAPRVDTAPTEPMDAVTPDTLPTAPMPAVPRQASVPEQPSSWLIVERPAVRPTSPISPARPTSRPPPPVTSGIAYAGAGRRSMTPLIVGLLVLLVLGGGGAIFALMRGGQAAATPPQLEQRVHEVHRR